MAGHEKGGDTAPPFLTGEVSLALLAGLFLPALGFLCHCLLSPPSCGFSCGALATSISVAAAWHAHPMSALIASRHLPRLLRRRARLKSVQLRAAPAISLGVA